MADFMQWMTHGVKRGRFAIAPQIMRGLAAFVVLATVLAVAYLLLVSQTAARGRHIEELREELFQVRRENEQLELQIAIESSVVWLRQRAAEKGYGQVGQTEFLVVGEAGRP
jgi:hypothetical protein